MRWILWIWKSALDFVFDMDLEKCVGFGFGFIFEK